MYIDIDPKYEVISTVLYALTHSINVIAQLSVGARGRIVLAMFMWFDK